LRSSGAFGRGSVQKAFQDPGAAFAEQSKSWLQLA
jgi:hypothetical protein